MGWMERGEERREQERRGKRNNGPTGEGKNRAKSACEKKRPRYQIHSFFGSFASLPAIWLDGRFGTTDRPPAHSFSLSLSRSLSFSVMDLKMQMP